MIIIRLVGCYATAGNGFSDKAAEPISEVVKVCLVWTSYNQNKPMYVRRELISGRTYTEFVLLNAMVFSFDLFGKEGFHCIVLSSLGYIVTPVFELPIYTGWLHILRSNHNNGRDRVS